ncbi:MAG: type II toxin-antitoxin system VapC family toxin [Waddliaceae bacterium]
MSTDNSYRFVLDCSVTMAWCFKDESNHFSDQVLEQMETAKVVVPAIWPLEVSNVLLLAKRRKRLSTLQVSSFADALSALSITVDPSTTTRAMHSIYVLAEKTKLTIYDAAYLELALREKVPLATLDKDLIKAAKKSHIELLEVKEAV